VIICDAIRAGNSHGSSGVLWTNSGGISPIWAAVTVAVRSHAAGNQAISESVGSRFMTDQIRSSHPLLDTEKGQKQQLIFEALL
jgi:hypothetical protein